MLSLLNYKEFGGSLPKTLFSGVDSCGSAYSSQLTQIQQWAHAESEIQHLALNVLALRGDTVLNELPEFSNPPAARLSGKSNSPKTNNQIANNNLNVYPNPSNGLFVVRLTNEMEGLSLSVVDVTGRNVFQFDFRGKFQEKSINLSHLSNGVYYVNCSSNGQYIGSAPIVIYR